MVNFTIGFVTGFGTGYFTRELMSLPRQGLRPTLKGIIRPIYQATLKTRESLAMAGETFEDLVAEMRAELASEASRTKKAGKAAPDEAVLAAEPEAASVAPAVEKVSSAGGR